MSWWCSHRGQQMTEIKYDCEFQSNLSIDGRKYVGHCNTGCVFKHLNKEDVKLRNKLRNKRKEIPKLKKQAYLGFNLK